jgi:hypothetical protein
MKALPEGQYVRHSQYGFGFVSASDPDRTRIDFDDHGEKLFVTSLMTVELAGDAPENSRAGKRRRKAASRKSAARA